MSVEALDQQIAAALARARARSDSLAAAIEQLDERLADADLDGTSMWEVHGAVKEHCDSAEADEGFLAEMLAVAPQLGCEVKILRTEHATLIALARRAAELTEAPLRRAAAEDLVESAKSHRDRATRLLADAYHVEVNPGD